MCVWDDSSLSKSNILVVHEPKEKKYVQICFFFAHWFFLSVQKNKDMAKKQQEIPVTDYWVSSMTEKIHMRVGIFVTSDVQKLPLGVAAYSIMTMDDLRQRGLFCLKNKCIIGKDREDVYALYIGETVHPTADDLVMMSQLALESETDEGYNINIQANGSNTAFLCMERK
jgi:hypothetical protein